MNENEFKKQREAILKQLEEWHTTGTLVINEREYKITKMTHQFRVEVASVYSQIEQQAVLQNYGFLTRDDVVKIMKKVDERILFDGMAISKLPNHFEEYPEDYFDYVTLTMKVICYPLYKTKLHIG